MSDLSYSIVRGIGLHVWWVTSKPVILHRDRFLPTGPFILAASHLSPFDVFVLLGAAPRHIDFLSITELKNTPFVGQLYTAMNSVFVDRARADIAATHQLVNRLQNGRIVAMFPEGAIREESKSVITGNPFKPGVIRLAEISRVPIVPCVVLGTAAYFKFKSWLPLRRTHWGINFGMPISVAADQDAPAARADATARLRQAYLDLTAELKSAMRPAQT